MSLELAKGLAEHDLWQRWRAHGDEEARERLLLLHMPYARIVAASYYARRMHDEIEFNDYLQLASLALIDAFGRFDPGIGVQFRTFAARRMHGAILDGIEHMTEKQQQIAANQRLQAQRRGIIKEGAAGASGVKGQPEGDRLLQYVAEVGLAFALSWLLDGTGMLNASERSESLAFYRNVELKQLRERILELVKSLPSQERRVVQCHYLQEMPFDEIAKDLRLTRGRISQVHRRALLRLKDAMTADPDCDVSW